MDTQKINFLKFQFFKFQIPKKKTKFFEFTNTKIIIQYCDMVIKE